VKVVQVYPRKKAGAISQSAGHLPEDVDRLDTLARIFGIGVILFEATNPAELAFDIRVRASNHEPEMFYVNRYMKVVEDQLFA
jgi:hypothetical protein